MADPLNRRLHDTLARPDGPTVHAARDQTIGLGDFIVSRNNDSSIEVHPGRSSTARLHRAYSSQTTRNGAAACDSAPGNGIPA